jgi:DinB superfamily
MSAQIDTVIDEIRAAQERLHRLVESTPDDRWDRRIDPARWSVAECVEHLNLTGRAYVPLIGAAIEEARRIGGAAPARYRRDPLGWLLWCTMGPPVRLRTRTTAPFVPSGSTRRDALVAEFDRLQALQIELARSADGLPLQRVRVASPFDPRVKYNLYACLTLLAPHQQRHLWQAEQLLAAE